MIDVKVGWEPKTFKATQVMQINPPKMEKFDDVSNMTYLNEASVLWNLKARYVAKLIYVSIVPCIQCKVDSKGSRSTTVERAFYSRNNKQCQIIK